MWPNRKLLKFIHASFFSYYQCFYCINMCLSVFICIFLLIKWMEDGWMENEDDLDWNKTVLMTIDCFTAYYRFVVLFFNCLLTFGSYFCFDIPSVLQDQFQGVSEQQWLSPGQSWSIVPRDSSMNFLSLQNLTCPNATVINGTVDCVLGLGMTPQQYNLLYAIYAWTYACTRAPTHIHGWPVKCSWES